MVGATNRSIAAMSGAWLRRKVRAIQGRAVRRLVPDHKTIADFRRDNGTAICEVCARFIALCRTMGLLTEACVAIDGSKFKAVNNRDKNFTRAKMDRRMAQIKESVARYLQQLDTADRQ